MMRLSLFIKTFIILILFMAITISVANETKVEERRQTIRNETNETLNKVYSVQPKAKDAVTNALGYATLPHY